MDTKKHLSQRGFLNTSLGGSGSALVNTSGLLAVVNSSHSLASIANNMWHWQSKYPNGME